MGLFTGMSMLSVIEVLVWLGRWVARCCGKAGERAKEALVTRKGQKNGDKDPEDGRH